MSPEAILAIVLVVVLVLLWKNGSLEKLHPYWYRTNLLPVNALTLLSGTWVASDGSNDTYTFASPDLTMRADAAKIVGMNPAPRAYAVERIMQYALTQGLYKTGESYMKTDALLRSALNTAFPTVRMSDIGKLAEPVNLTIRRADGTSTSVQYAYEIGFATVKNGAITNSFIRLTRKNTGDVYNLRVVPNVDGYNQLFVESDGGSVLLGTQKAV